MLRYTPIFRAAARKSHGSRYCYSTLAELTRNLKENDVNSFRENVARAIQNVDSSNSSAIHELVDSVRTNNTIDETTKHDLTNRILVHALEGDYSLYFTVKKNSHIWSPEALQKLILANPGRVDQAWDLLERYGSRDGTSRPLALAVAEKLLFGERVEIRDESVDEEMNLDRFARALYMVKEATYGGNGGEDLPEGLVNRLVEVAVQLDVISSLTFVPALKNQQLLPVLTTLQNDQHYFTLFSKIFQESPEILSKESLCKALGVGPTVVDVVDSETSAKQLEKIDRIKQVFRELAGEGATVETSSTEEIPNHNTTTTTDKVLKYIEVNHLDSDKSPESLLVRLRLISTYGIDRDDIQTALAKFHHYQSHEKFGIDFVQHRLVSVFCYQAIKSHNDQYLKIAQTLLTSESVPVDLLGNLILARGEFSNDAPLELYNEYINQVPRVRNEHTGRSASGRLTESMILASLYGNDREFGFLLFDRASETGIFVDEHERAIVKKLFKVYGDAFIEDNWESAREHLKQFVLKEIRSGTRR
ncbi:MIOREX complex component 12 [[Candida] anglica]